MAGNWRAFTIWCASRAFAPLPADPLVVAAYLAFAANIVRPDGEWAYGATTLSAWLSSINKAHFLAGEPLPGHHQETKLTMEGIRRERRRPINRRAPLLLEDLQRVLPTISINSRPGGVIGHRDRAILLIGFGGAFRRSELAGLELRDVSLHPDDGLHINLRHSKTDQTGLGLIKAIPRGTHPVTCAPCAFVHWSQVLVAAETGRDVLGFIAQTSSIAHVCHEVLPRLAPGPLFRPVMKNGTIKDRPISGAVVHDMLQRRLKVAGYDEKQYGGHSLRAGFVTQAFREGATHHEIMRQTGHANPATVEIYSREKTPLAHNAVVKIRF